MDVWWLARRQFAFTESMCMLEWRHSGLVKHVNRTPAGLQARVGGLWIG
jgi:hypothetical protein